MTKDYYFSGKRKVIISFYETSPYAAPGKKEERQGRKEKEKIYTVDYMNKWIKEDKNRRKKQRIVVYKINNLD